MRCIPLRHEVEDAHDPRRSVHDLHIGRGAGRHSPRFGRCHASPAAADADAGSDAIPDALADADADASAVAIADPVALADSVALAEPVALAFAEPIAFADASVAMQVAYARRRCSRC